MTMPLGPKKYGISLFYELSVGNKIGCIPVFCCLESLPATSILAIILSIVPRQRHLKFSMICMKSYECGIPVAVKFVPDEYYHAR